MNILEQLKSVIPALVVMAVCSAAILFLPQWGRDGESLPNASSVPQPKAPPGAPQERDKQA